MESSNNIVQFPPHRPEAEQPLREDLTPVEVFGFGAGLVAVRQEVIEANREVVVKLPIHRTDKQAA